MQIMNPSHSESETRDSLKREVDDILVALTSDYFDLVRQVLANGEATHPVVVHLNEFCDDFGITTDDAEVRLDEYFYHVKSEMRAGMMVSPIDSTLKTLLLEFCNPSPSLIERLDVLTLKLSSEHDWDDFDYKTELWLIARKDSYEKALVAAAAMGCTEAITCFLGLLYLHELMVRDKDRPWVLWKKLKECRGDAKSRLSLRKHYHEREIQEAHLADVITEHLKTLGCSEPNQHFPDLIADIFKRRLPSDFFDPDRVLAWQNEQRAKSKQTHCRK